MLKERRRPDGRKFDEVRNIECEVGVLPSHPRSALFTRGETQALVTATLAPRTTSSALKLLDSSETSKRFMLHYNFPPFSVGEVGFMRVCRPPRKSVTEHWPSELSQPSFRTDKTFHYTMRIVSDIMESNGFQFDGIGGAAHRWL